MISAKQALIIRLVAQSGPITVQELLRASHARVRKEEVYEYLKRLAEMGVLASAYTAETGPGRPQRPKVYWLTERGKRAHECYEFLESLSHRGAKWGGGEEIQDSP